MKNSIFNMAVFIKYRKILMCMFLLLKTVPVRSIIKTQSLVMISFLCVTIITSGYSSNCTTKPLISRACCQLETLTIAQEIYGNGSLNSLQELALIWAKNSEVDGDIEEKQPMAMPMKTKNVNGDRIQVVETSFANVSLGENVRGYFFVLESKQKFQALYLSSSNPPTNAHWERIAPGIIKPISINSKESNLLWVELYDSTFHYQELENGDEEISKRVLLSAYIFRKSATNLLEMVACNIPIKIENYSGDSLVSVATINVVFKNEQEITIKPKPNTVIDELQIEWIGKHFIK